jgi:hypothetical protein
MRGAKDAISRLLRGLVSVCSFTRTPCRHFCVDLFLDFLGALLATQKDLWCHPFLDDAQLPPGVVFSLSGNLPVCVGLYLVFTYSFAGKVAKAKIILGVSITLVGSLLKPARSLD